jgi:chromosome partitioning protein
MKIITAAANKGGTGKTTTIAALAQAAAAAGKKVIVLDMDPQTNATYFIGANMNKDGCYELLHGADPATLIQHTAQGIDVICGSPDLATERTSTGSAMRLQKAIEPLQAAYDYCFIDTPPQIGEPTINALQASTGLIIPLEADHSSMQGLMYLSAIAHHMQKTNPGLSIMGTILTRYNSRPKINRTYQQAIVGVGLAAGAPYLMAIRPGIAIREAQALQKSIYDYAPNSNPAQDYLQLFGMVEAAA